MRRSAKLRGLAAQISVRPGDLLLPLFVKEGISEPQPVTSMPGVVQHTRDSLRKAAVDAVEAGVGGLVLFGIPAVKDARGSAADDPAGIIGHALRDLSAEVGGDTVLIADLCLCEYTDHGHCGLLTDDHEVDNDATLERYASIACAQAVAGADVVGPGTARSRSAPTRRSTPRPSTARSARPPRARPSSATGPPTSRISAAPRRRCARWNWMWTRAPTSSW
jgi:porphobilinogen synthase